MVPLTGDERMEDQIADSCPLRLIREVLKSLFAESLCKKQTSPRQPAHHRAQGNLERFGGFAITEPLDANQNEHHTQLVRKLENLLLRLDQKEPAFGIVMLNTKLL